MFYKLSEGNETQTGHKLVGKVVPAMKTMHLNQFTMYSVDTMEDKKIEKNVLFRLLDINKKKKKIPCSTGPIM